MKKFILPVLAIALFGSCDSNNDGIDPNGNNGRIDLHPGIEAFTRSPHLNTDGSGSFSEGDVFTLTLSAEDGHTATKDYTMPSTPLYWEDFQWAESTKTVSFAGCYPKHNAETGKSTFIFNVNEAKDDGKDLLLASAVKVNIGSTNPINLPFHHAMHKLVIKYKSDDYGEEALKNIQTTLKGEAECTVNLMEGIVTEVTSSDVENYEPQTGKEISTLIVPQPKSKVSLSIQIGDETKEYELSNLPQNTSEGQNIDHLGSGKMLVVELTINKNGITVSGMTIQGWESQGSVSGDVTIG